MNDPLWGIDLGGTKIEGVILPSIEETTPLLRLRIDTERSKGYKHILQRISSLVHQMQTQSGL